MKTVGEMNLLQENMKLKSEVAFLESKVDAYEWFLKTKGFLGGEE